MEKFPAIAWMEQTIHCIWCPPLPVNIGWYEVQEKVSYKRNEMTAIPNALNLLDLEGYQTFDGSEYGRFQERLYRVVHIPDILKKRHDRFNLRVFLNLSVIQRSSGS